MPEGINIDAVPLQYLTYQAVLALHKGEEILDQQGEENYGSYDGEYLCVVGGKQRPDIFQETDNLPGIECEEDRPHRDSDELQQLVGAAELVCQPFEPGLETLCKGHGCVRQLYHSPCNRVGYAEGLIHVRQPQAPCVADVLDGIRDREVHVGIRSVDFFGGVQEGIFQVVDLDGAFGRHIEELTFGYTQVLRKDIGGFRRIFEHLVEGFRVHDTFLETLVHALDDTCDGRVGAPSSLHHLSDRRRIVCSVVHVENVAGGF